MQYQSSTTHMKCDACGEEHSLSQTKQDGQYTICCDCLWLGVTAEDLRRDARRPARVARNQAERLADVGLWRGR